MPGWKERRHRRGRVEREAEVFKSRRGGWVDAGAAHSPSLGQVHVAGLLQMKCEPSHLRSAGEKGAAQHITDSLD